jgi:hypothetical protein
VSAVARSRMPLACGGAFPWAADIKDFRDSANGVEVETILHACPVAVAMNKPSPR